jgi:DNA-directed RNA polymerase I, II, and III subunit RPABC5
MIIPMRCFTCGRLLADKYEEYHELLRSKYSENDALTCVGLERFCCRRMMLTHVDFNDTLLRFNPADNAPARTQSQATQLTGYQ